MPLSDTILLPSFYVEGGICYTVSGTVKKYEDECFSYIIKKNLDGPDYFTNIEVKKEVADDNSYMIYSYIVPPGFMVTNEVTSYLLRTFYGSLSLDNMSSRVTKTIYFDNLKIGPVDPPTTESYTLNVYIDGYRVTRNIGVNTTVIDGIKITLRLLKSNSSKYQQNNYTLQESLSLRFNVRGNPNQFDSTIVFLFTNFTINKGYNDISVDSQYLLYSSNIRPSSVGGNIVYDIFESTTVNWLDSISGSNPSSIKVKLSDGTNTNANIEYHDTGTNGIIL